MSKKTKKVALVTGGTRGIGAAIVKAFVKAGYITYANYIDSKVEAEKFKKAANCEIIKFDASDYNDVQKAVAKITKAHGPVDVLVNNAGITRDGFLHKMDLADWQAVINVNLSSVFNTCRAVLPAMREKSYGRIVNISSINALKGQFGQANYAAAKAGMIGFTKSIAQENAAKGITCNIVAPGYTKTEMTSAMKPEILDAIVQDVPVGRMAKPEEMADMVHYLTTDKAAFITGATFSVNGGQHMY